MNGGCGGVEIQQVAIVEVPELYCDYRCPVPGSHCSSSVRIH